MNAKKEHTIAQPTLTATIQWETILALAISDIAKMVQLVMVIISSIFL